MDIFTLALYIILIGLVATMVVKLFKQERGKWVEKRRLRRLNSVGRRPYNTKHGQRTGRRK